MLVFLHTLLDLLLMTCGGDDDDNAAAAGGGVVVHYVDGGDGTMITCAIAATCSAA